MKLVWTREEDIRADRYRPQAALRMRAALRRGQARRRARIRTAVGSITRSLGWGKVENGVERRRSKGWSNCPYRCDALKVGVEPAEEHARAGDVLALGRLVAERLRGRELHRRDARRRRAPTRWSSGARCWPARPDFLACSTRWRKRATGASRCRRARGAASRSTRAFGTIVGEMVEVAVSDERRGRVAARRRLRRLRPRGQSAAPSRCRSRAR